MRVDLYSLGPVPLQEKADLRVRDDFPPDMPVTDAELDVVEAFLGEQLRAILAETPEMPRKTAPKASKDRKSTQ